MMLQCEDTLRRLMERDAVQANRRLRAVMQDNRGSDDQPRHGAETLKDQRIRTIREMTAEGATGQEISERLGVERATLRRYAGLWGITLPRWS